VNRDGQYGKARTDVLSKYVCEKRQTELIDIRLQISSVEEPAGKHRFRTDLLSWVVTRDGASVVARSDLRSRSGM